MAVAASTSALTVIQPKPLPQGTPEYEARRAAILETFAKRVPTELRLPSEFFKDPPLNVSSVPATCGILTPTEVEITENYDTMGLAEAIATRKLTSLEITTAFCKRSIIAHQLTCCLTQWFMSEALEQAKELDAYLEKHGKTKGPFHGVPVSIKEHMPIKGTYSSYGSLASTQFDEKDCLMVALLREMGAVFYCKTNQPQLIMHLESTSHYGRTLNPFNTNLSSGGSSGGEGALIAMKGSVMGVGTDIGGSIRGPGAFNGIYGFKPTSYTLPTKNFLSHASSAEMNVLACGGPMCQSLRDTEYFMTSILDTKPYIRDQKLIPLPWTGLKTSFKKPLKIGIISNDGFIDPQPPVKRAIAWAQSLLSDPKLSGLVEVKPFKPFNAAEAWSLIRRMYWPGGDILPRADIESTGEPVLPLSSWIMADATPHGMLTAEQVNDMREQRDAFRYAFADSWNDQDVDIVIGPAFVGPACKHETAFYWTYTSLWNFVDYPGIVVPTPIKAEKGDRYAESYAPLSEACGKVKELWEEGGFEGAPVNLQICARRYHDNELFGALAVLKDILQLH